MAADAGAHVAAYSVNHGAGRCMGRKAADRALDQKTVDDEFVANDILTNCRLYPKDEAPAAYKDFDAVLDSVKAAGLVSEVARLKARAGTEPQSLNEADSKEVLRLYGIGTPQEAFVTSLADAVTAAAHIGYPVVLKAVSGTLTHKSDAGAVVLNLASADALRAAYEKMSQNLAGHALAG